MNHLTKALIVAALCSFSVLLDLPSAYAAPSDPNSYPVPAYSPQDYSANKGKSSNAEQPFFGGFEVGAQYPLVLGNFGEAFKPGLGLHGVAHLNLLGDFRTGLYVGYQNLPLRTNPNVSFKILPVLAQFGVEGKTHLDWLYTSFDIGIGGAMGWLDTVGANEFTSSGYFAVQIQPGLEAALTDMFSIVFHMPVLYLIGAKPMGYIAYDGGVKINL